MSLSASHGLRVDGTPATFTTARPRNGYGTRRTLCRVPSPNLLDQYVSYRIRYGSVEIRESEVYARWFERLRDVRARARILARIRRLSLGNPGDAEPVGGGISELRIDYGPGYRVYYKQQGKTLAILLAGGVKRTQKRDIEKAKELARGL